MFSTLFTRSDNARPAHPQLVAIGYILISTTAFSALNVSVRAISTDLHATLIVMLRCFIALILLAPFIMHYGASALRTTRLKAHAIRGIIGGAPAWWGGRTA
jgi:hypothetical protein